MKSTVTLKHSMSCLDDLEVQVDIDPERLEVILELEHFDSCLVAHCVTQLLPERGVRAYWDDSKKRGETWLTPGSTYQLFVLFGGRRHKAQVVRLVGGEATVWLENPREDFARRYKATAAAALQWLHEQGVSAIVTGDTGSEAFWPESTVEVHIDDRKTPVDAKRLSAHIESMATAPVHVHAASDLVDGNFERLLRGAHLRWDSVRGAVVRQGRTRNRSLLDMAGMLVRPPGSPTVPIEKLGFPKHDEK